MTSRSLQVLNAVKDKIVEIANENGIVLADHFDSVDDFKKFTLCLTFQVALKAGLSTRDAYNLVAGDGAYDALVKEVWERA